MSISDSFLEPSFDPLPSDTSALSRRNKRSRNMRAWETIRVSLVCDLVSIVLSLSFALWIDESSGQAPLFLLLLFSWIFLIWSQKGYTFHARVLSSGLRSVLLSSIFLFAFVGFWSQASSNVSAVRIVALVGIPLGALLLALGRLVASRLNKGIRQKQPSRLLLLGTVKDILNVLGEKQSGRFPYHQVTALLVTDPENAGRLPNLVGCEVRSFAFGDSIVVAASEMECDSVWVVSVNDFGDKHLRRLMWSLRNQNIRLYLEPMIEGTSGTRINSERFGQRPVLYIEPPRFDAANGYSKRFIDIVLSLIVLILISPVFLIVAVAIKLEDGGPVFYKSERIGIYGKPFQVWKFRSMVVDAESRVNELIASNGGNALLFKMKDDPRVTKVGHFIRRYSIDEVPQFINSLNGTMSIVGPRPPLRREVDLYGIDMRMRLEVRPGITGLWQVSGRSNLSAKQAQDLDLYYVDNWSALLDLKIFLKTFGVVLRSEGAY